MATKHDHTGYVTDETLISNYSSYQDKYKDEPRESDRTTIGLVEAAVGNRGDADILDIACSTGNLLRHMARRLDQPGLVGADMAVDSLEICKQDPELQSIDFHYANLLDLSTLNQRFDAITASAVTFLFKWDDYLKALQSLHAALKPGGCYVGFEFANPFDVQDLTIIETNEWNPDGMTLHIRPVKKVRQALTEAGFERIEFHPFVLPIDLEFPGHDKDVVTYTRKDEHGERMAFRGAIYQPWCHIVAHRKS